MAQGNPLILVNFSLAASRYCIYSSHLTTWRKQRQLAGEAQLLEPKRGPKIDPAAAQERKVRELENEVARLRDKLANSVLVTAMLSGSAASGAAAMLAFGLGTLPALLALGLAGAQLRAWLQRRAVRIACGALVLGFDGCGSCATTPPAARASG